MTRIKRLELTEDGSHTLYVPDLNAHYHSVYGAIQETRHIYLEAGFRYIDKNPIHIFEVGFGTGLNAYITLIEAEKLQREVFYHTIELHPVEKSLLKDLNYPGLIDYPNKELFYEMHNVAWNTVKEVTPGFYLQKTLANICSYEFTNNYDVVYFDAFAPDVQPELWTADIFEKIYNCLNSGAVMVTYSTKGMVKEALRNAGFTIQRLPGPPGKRQILRAIKPESVVTVKKT